MNDSGNFPTEDEISLLDLLVTVAENIRLLILGPLLAGLAALGIGFAITPTYESTSVLVAEKSIRLPNDYRVTTSSEYVASVALQPDTFDAVAQAIGLTPALSTESARKELMKRVKASVGKKDKLLTITTRAKTSAEAKALNDAVLKVLLQRIAPRGAEREAIEKSLGDERASLQEGLSLERRLAAEMAKSGPRDDVSARLYTNLLAANSSKAQLVAALEAQLNGLSADDVVQPPTLPEKPIQPKKAMIAVVSALAVGFALLLFVFVRQALRTASEDPESAGKIARIRAALGLRQETAR